MGNQDVDAARKRLLRRYVDETDDEYDRRIAASNRGRDNYWARKLGSMMLWEKLDGAWHQIPYRWNGMEWIRYG